MAFDGTLKFDTSIDDGGLDKGLDSLQQKATDALGVLTGGLMDAAVSALKNLATEAWNAGTSLEAGMAKVSTLFTGTDEELGALTNEIRALSSASGLAADGLAEAAYSALSASVPAEDLGLILEKSTKLAAAGFTDVDNALSATAKTMNAYGVSGEEAMDKIQKVLIQTQNKGITTVDELGRSLAQVTPTAASFGVAFEQVGAALAVMTAQGVPTAEATTQLNGIIAELGKSGTRAAKNLAAAAEGTKYAGMNFTEMMASGATLDEVLGMLSDYADKTGQSMVDMFSRIEAGKGALSILANEGQTFRDDLAAMTTDVDVVGEAYEKVANTVQFKSDQIKTSFSNLASGLFDLASGPIKDVQDVAIDALGRIQEGLSEGGLAGMGEAVIGLLEDAADAIADFDWAEAAGAVADAIGEFIEGDGLGRLLGAVTGAMSSIAEGISANLPTLLTAAVQAVGYVRQTLWDQLPALLEMGATLIEGLADGVAQALPVMIRQAGSIVSSIVGALAEGVPKLIEAGADLLLAIADAVPAAVEELEGAIPEIADAIVRVLEGSTPTLLDSAFGLFQTLVQAAAAIVPMLTDALPGVISAIVAVVQEAVPVLLDAAMLLFRALVDALPPVLDLLAAALPEILAAVADILIEGVPLVLEAAMLLLGAIVDALPAVMDMLADALPLLIDAAIRILTDAVPLILDAAVLLFQAIVDALPAIIDLLAEELPHLIIAVTDFLIGSLPDILDAAITMLNALVEAIPVIIDALTAALPDIIEAVVTVLVEATPELLDAAITLLMAVVDAIPTILDALADALPDIIDMIFKFVVDAIPQLLELALELFGKIAEAIPPLIARLVDLVPKIVETIYHGLAGLPGKIMELLASLAKTWFDWVPRAISAIYEAAGKIGGALLEGLIGLPGKLWDICLDCLDTFWEFSGDGVETMANAAKEICEALLGYLVQIPSLVLDIGKNVVSGLWNGIKEGWGTLTSGFGNLVDGLVGGAKDVLGINSPSRRFRIEVGKWIPPGITDGVEEAMPAALRDLDKQADELVARMQDAVQGDLGDVDMKLSATGNVAAAPAIAVAGEPAKWEQTNNYYVPVVTPSEAARTQREALRSYVGGVQ